MGIELPERNPPGGCGHYPLTREELIEKYLELIPDIHRRLVRRGFRDIVDDVLQDVAILLSKCFPNPNWRFFEDERFDERMFSTFCHTTASFTAITHWRRQQRRPSTQSSESLEMYPTDDPPPDEQCALNEVTTICLELFNELPDRERKVLTLRLLEGKSHSEIAAELGCTDKAIKALIHRAYLRLREKARQRGLDIPPAEETDEEPSE